MITKILFTLGLMTGAAQATTSYVVDWGHKGDYSYGSFAAIDLNNDGFIINNELSRFYSVLDNSSGGPGQFYFTFSPSDLLPFSLPVWSQHAFNLQGDASIDISHCFAQGSPPDCVPEYTSVSVPAIDSEATLDWSMKTVGAVPLPASMGLLLTAFVPLVGRRAIRSRNARKKSVVKAG